MFGLSGGEILFIALLCLVLFGNEKLPGNIKKIVSGINHAKKVKDQAQQSWEEIKEKVKNYIVLDDLKVEHAKKSLEKKNNCKE